MAVAVGDHGPDFELPATDGTAESHRTIALAGLRGRPVVLVFYPGDDTPVCTEQLNAYTRDVGRFQELDAEVLAISPQSLESHDRFSVGQGGFAFPLLADEDKSVGRSYGIVGPLGFYRRSVFVLDAHGVVRWVHRALAGMRFQPTDELVNALTVTDG